MTPAQRLAELRAKATGTYWERYGFIGHYDLARVRCPIGCDRVGRQKYADVPVHGHDAAFIVYAANHAADIAARERELEERCEKLRERLSTQTKATQTIASELHNRVAESIVRIIGQPDYVDVQGHPIEQVVGTVLWRMACDHQDTKDQLASKDAEVERLRSAAKSFLFWFDADGTPVDGFRFQEERVKLEEALKPSEATDNETAR